MTNGLKLIQFRLPKADTDCRRPFRKGMQECFFHASIVSERIHPINLFFIYLNI